jgi:hypothetical protein
VSPDEKVQRTQAALHDLVDAIAAKEAANLLAGFTCADCRWCRRHPARGVFGPTCEAPVFLGRNGVEHQAGDVWPGREACVGFEPNQERA